MPKTNTARRTAPARARRPREDRDPLSVLNGQIGAIERHHPEQDTTDLRQQAKMLRLARYVEEIVNEAPPLSASQRAELARIIRNSKPSDGAA